MGPVTRRPSLVVLALVAAAATAATAATAGCALDWPASSQGDALGPETTRRGPTHRPGQPCLWCHGGPAPRAQTFAVAGTIYLREADATGVAGATITITDAQGQTLTATSNQVGSFFVRVQSGSGAPRDRGDGELDSPWEPTFPLHVVVSAQGTERRMRSIIGRDGSCAACHREPPGAAMVGKVWVTP
jgi:hypothetical protein